MITILAWVVLGFIIIVSALDWKTQSVPSVMLTTMLFVIIIFNQANLMIGLLGFVMAYMLLELDFYSGVADVKVMTIIAFMLGSVGHLFIFIILTVVFGATWKIVWNLRFRAKKQKIPKTFPFLPVFIFVYLSLLLAGGFL